MYKKYIKRAADIFISAISILLLSPLFILISGAILITDGRPVFYSGERIGRNCSIFRMYKFRSMKVNAVDIRNEDGSTYNSVSDERVTKTGRFLRETSLDELPQLLNVLKGEMSIIGPRASTADAMSTYQEDETDKMLVRPGITGYTQAYFRNSIGVRDKRLRDAWYARNMSLKMDIKIFFKTFTTVIKRKGLYTNQINADAPQESKEISHV